MFSQIVTPKKLNSTELDNLLEMGYFRMGNEIFTTNFIRFNNKFFGAIWLRLFLKKFEPTSTQQKIRKICEKKFEVIIKHFIYNQEKEELFQQYRNSVLFETAKTLQALLYDESLSNSVFNTFEIGLYDNSKLIAVGIFDMGTISAAGIVSFYNPHYSKYSLGKFLVLEKIKFCNSKGLDFFYPGYFVPSYKMFDYKLNISKNGIQFLNFNNGQWLSINDFDTLKIPLNNIKHKLEILTQKLNENSFSCNVVSYRYFDAVFNPSLRHEKLFDHPYFIFFKDVDNNFVMPAIIYDVQNDEYVLIKFISIWHVNDFKQSKIEYGSNLLQILDTIFVSNDTDKLVNFLKS